LLGIIGLKRVTVNTASASGLTSKSNGGRQLDDRRLIFDCFGFLDGFLHSVDIMITILDVQSMPSVSFETFQDILSEGALYQLGTLKGNYTSGVSVDTDMVVIVHANQISQLQVSGQGSSFASNAFLSATVAKVAESIIV